MAGNLKTICTMSGHLITLPNKPPRLGLPQRLLQRPPQPPPHNRRLSKPTPILLPTRGTRLFRDRGAAISCPVRSPQNLAPTSNYRTLVQRKMLSYRALSAP